MASEIGRLAKDGYKILAIVANIRPLALLITLVGMRGLVDVAPRILCELKLSDVVAGFRI